MNEQSEAKDLLSIIVFFMAWNFLIIVLLSFPPVLFWGYFFYKKDTKEPEPLRLMALAFLYGIFAALFVMLLQFFLNEWGQWNLVSWLGSNIQNEYVMYVVLFALLGFIEEYVKYFSVVKLVENHRIHFDQIIDGIEYAVAAALGFAFVENVYYFFTEFSGDYMSLAFLGILLYRSLGTMLAHTIFSGILGYFYALSRRLPHIVREKGRHPLHHFHRHLHKAFTFHVLRRHVLRDRASKHGHDPGRFITEGLLIAGVLHMLFNFFMSVSVFGLNLAYLNIVLLMGSLYFLLKAFRKRRNTEIG